MLYSKEVMEKARLVRILRIASTQFNNIATGYFGVSVFAPVFIANIRFDVAIVSVMLGICCLLCAYFCDKVLDEL